MPGIKINLSTSEAKAASDALTRSLNTLGIEAKDNEQQFNRLETRLHGNLSLKKTDAAVDELTRSLKLTRIETAKLQAQTGNYSGAVKTMIARNKSASASFNSLFRVVGLMGGIYGLQRVAKSAIDTASSFEKMEAQLDILTKGKGAETLDRINKWALDMPVNTAKAVDSFRVMTAMGLEPTLKTLGTLTDVASIFGDDVLSRLTLQLGQMSAKGKVMAQDLNIMAEAGINARKYLKDAYGMTVEEIQNSSIDIKDVIATLFAGMEKDFGGSAKRMMSTWSGLMTVIKSYIVEVERTVAEAGIFDSVKGDLQGLVDKVKEMQKDGSLKEWAEETSAALVEVKDAVYGIAHVLDNIGGENLAYGYIGLKLFGKNPWLSSAAVTMLGLYNAIKSVKGEVKQLNEWPGLFDDDGSLNVGTDVYYRWLEYNSVLEGTNKEIKELTKESDEFAKSFEEVNQKGEDAVKTLHNVTKETEWGTQEWKDYADSVSWMQSEMDLFADSVGDVDVALEKQTDTLKETAKVSKETVEDMGIGWDDFSKSLVGTLSGTFSGEFDSIGGMFDDLLGSMYSMFVNWAAKVAAQQIIFNISSGSAGANTLGSMFSGGSGSGGAISNLSSLFSGAKTGYQIYENGGSLGGGMAEGFGLYNSAHTLPAGVAGPTTSGGLTTSGYLGIIGAAIIAQNMATGYNQKHGYNTGYVNGEEVTHGDILSFNGSNFNDPITSMLTGISGGHIGGHQYADMAAQTGDWGEWLKGMATEFLDLSIGMPFLNPFAKMFGLGDDPKKSKFAMQVGLTHDADGNLVGSGIGPNPMTGEDMWGQYIHGEGYHHVVNEPFAQVDEYIGSLVDAFGASVGLFSNSLIEPLKPKFDAAVEQLIADFSFVFTGKDKHEDIGAWLTKGVADLDTALSDLLAPTIAAFTDLQVAIGEITPAVMEFNSALADTAASYFDPLLSIDQKILNSSDDKFTQQFRYTMYEDAASQVATYKTLYDNVIANGAGFDAVVKFGNLYTDALANFQKMAEGDGFYTSGFSSNASADVINAANADLTMVLKGLREDMINAGGTADQFQESVNASLSAFATGINAGLDKLVAAIQALHPSIKIDVSAYKVVEQIQVSATTERAAA